MISKGEKKSNNHRNIEANFLKQRKQLGRAKLTPVKDPIPQIKFQVSKLSYKIINQIKNSENVSGRTKIIIIVSE